MAASFKQWRGGFQRLESVPVLSGWDDDTAKQNALFISTAK